MVVMFVARAWGMKRQATMKLEARYMGFRPNISLSGARASGVTAMLQKYTELPMR